MAYSIDYNTHPSFPDQIKPWEVSQEHLRDFETLFKFCMHYGNALSAKDKTLLQEKCQDRLTQIFQSLTCQTQSEREKQFLGEISDYSIQLLEDDLRFYFRKIKSHRFSDINKVENVLNISTHLAQKKYFVGHLNLESTTELQQLAKPQVSKFLDKAKHGHLTREDLSTNSDLVVSHLVNRLSQEFDHQGVNEAVSLYTGFPMQVAGLALELSVSSANWWHNGYAEVERPPKTLYFHTDESLHFPKAIVYLSDVTPSQGPTGFLQEGSDIINPTALQSIIGRVIHKIGRSSASALYSTYHHQYHQPLGCPKFREDFMKLPQELRFNSHFGWDILPGSDLESQLISSEKKLLGKAGTFIIFDGSQLVHRGGLVESGERVAMQVIFHPKPTMARKIIHKITRLSPYGLVSKLTSLRE